MAEQALKAYENGARGAAVMEALDYWYGDISNVPVNVKKPAVTDAVVNEWVKYFNDYTENNYGMTGVSQVGANKYKVSGELEEKAVKDIYSDESLTNEQRLYLLDKLGISPEIINNVANTMH